MDLLSLPKTHPPLGSGRFPYVSRMKATDLRQFDHSAELQQTNAVPNSMPHAQGNPRMPSGMHFTSASRTLSEALKASPFLNTPAEWRVDINPRAHPREYPRTRRGWWARGQTISQQAAERDSPR